MVTVEAAPIDFTKSEYSDIQDQFKRNFDKLLKVDLTGLTRKGAIDALGEIYSDRGMVNLIAMNIVYAGDKAENVKWQSNIENMANSGSDLMWFDESLRSDVPLLAFTGANSK